MPIKQLHQLCSILILALILSACGTTSPGQPDVNATIAAGVQTTDTARQQASSIPLTIEAGIQATQAAQQSQSTSSALPASTSPPIQQTSTLISPATQLATAAPAMPATSAPAEATPIIFQPDAGPQSASITNIELVFDASGSMAQNIGTETKIDAARRAIARVIDSLPDNNPRLNVGFRVYGHRGSNSEADKALSCQSTDLLVPVQGVNKQLLREQANAWQPTGWTPLTLALQKAGEDLKPGENMKNVIIMVTDGEETCDGDPCALAQALAASGAEVRIDVVGFGLEPGIDKSLRCIAENSGGSYLDVRDGDSLAQTLETLIAETARRSFLRIRVLGPDGNLSRATLDSFKDAQGNPVDISNEADKGKTGPALDDGQQRIELAPGTYSFTISPLAQAKQTAYHQERTYTAVVVEGQETIADVGFGGIRLTNAGAPENYRRDLQLEIAYQGEWREAWGVDPLWDWTYPIAPGNYRLIDTKRKLVLVDSIVVTPGKLVSVSVKAP